MGHFIYTLKVVRREMLTDGPDRTEAQILDNHLEYLRDLTESGAGKFIGRTLTTGPETFGVVVFSAADEASARRIMEQDPAVAQGVMTAELQPFSIVLVGDLSGQE